MATKKKAKSRIKAKKPTAKKTKKKVVKKKAVARKSAVRKSVPAKRPAAAKTATAASIPMAVPAMLPGEERIGIVTHYYGHLSVAIIQIEAGSLRTGDTLHIKGHTSDFRQTVESMELDHVHIEAAYAGQVVGLRVKEHARESDIVYKVTKTM